MKYIVVLNNDSILDGGEDPDFDETKYEIEQLLTSGYYEVESIKEIFDA